MPASPPLPTVGLGMPVYNGERYVTQAIESILRQSLGEFELVICDNASTDQTEGICRSFAALDGRVRYFRNDVNLGAHPNYTRTFELSRGQYFKWAAHDDILQPDFLRSCIDALENRPVAAVCQSDIDYIDEDGISLGVHQHHVPGSESDDAATRFAALVLRPHDCYDMMGVFRRGILDDSMLLPSFHGADRALLAQVALSGPFISVPGALLQVRDHEARYSRAHTKPKERAAWHDTRNTGRFSFPVWRLYGTYWKTVSDAPLTGAAKRQARAALLEWWFRNYNAARMAIDLVGSVAPGAMGLAEGIKQTFFSPAPGAGEVRRPKKH